MLLCDLAGVPRIQIPDRAGGVVLGRVNHEGREIAWLTSLSCGVLRGIFLAQEHVGLFA